MSEHTNTSAQFQIAQALNQARWPAWAYGYAANNPPCESGVHGVTCGGVPLSLAVTQPGFLAYMQTQQRVDEARGALRQGISDYYNQNFCIPNEEWCGADNGLAQYFHLKE